jgi:hypothetical protein
MSAHRFPGAWSADDTLPTGADEAVLIGDAVGTVVPADNVSIFDGKTPVALGAGAVLTTLLLSWGLLAATLPRFESATAGRVAGKTALGIFATPVVPIAGTISATDVPTRAGVLVAPTFSFAGDPSACGATACETTSAATLSGTALVTVGGKVVATSEVEARVFLPLSGLDVFLVSTFCALPSFVSPFVPVAATAAPITEAKLLWKLPLLSSAAAGLPVVSGTAFINWLNIFTQWLLQH